MKLVLAEMRHGIRADWITPTSPTFRPSTWPPARDWPVSIDRDGTVLSRWGDSVWDLTPIAGTIFKLNFGDGASCKTDPLDRANADILRLIVTWRMWGPRPVRAAGTLQRAFTVVRSIVAVCSRNGILVSNLMQFPKVLEQVPAVLAPSRYESTITELHRLYDAREALGLTILDLYGLKRLAIAMPDHDKVQTPYIPPRIWVYQVERLRECLVEFLAYREQVQACFRYCLDAYVGNYGSIEAAVQRDKDPGKVPFTKNSLVRIGCTYHGPFVDIADRFGLTALFQKWLNVERKSLSVQQLSSYLSLVTAAGLAYVANFTLQRKEEVASLRTSCLVWEQDEKLGRVPIVCGETTKTDPDSDARWVASPSVETAIQALSIIAELRMICDANNPQVAATVADKEDPYLFSMASEPWGGGKLTAYHIRRDVDSLTEIARYYPKLFDSAQLCVTQEDLKVARQLTPNLPDDKFAVGLPWPLAWHQYRRTSAVNMFASGLISDSSMQQQMKHCSRLMPLYYGRGYTRLHLNENVETTIITAMYEALAKQLLTAMSDRFVFPQASEQKHAVLVNILTVKDTKTLTEWARSGKVSFREHRLGGCMKVDVCDYGGVESVSRCAGGDGGKPCRDVAFDREKEPQVRIALQRIAEEMVGLPDNSPRYQALLADRRGMESYLNVIAS
ncbi:hypothetical protein [Duganella vulcania]|uniref:Integrase n=1 Tax=Duganella vulcania TaxID=2692166 RepID=A0A845GQR5_9BURK|nr:hypothetical protein [Duganella vulcania]MYM96873.1 hypothetical protein [Duganella vulcania]